MLRPVPLGAEISRERTARHVRRHCHFAPYAALVLRGGYVEAGDRGRYRARPGDVLLHDRFESHQDHFDQGGADILNLALDRGPAVAFGRIADPDDIARRAERDPREAALALLTSLIPEAEAAGDWPDMLARALDCGEVRSLAEWAVAVGLAGSSVSRGFARAYGVSPQRFRADRRACRAARAILESATPLAALAIDLGFADQSHMSREISLLTGIPPRRLRRSGVKCVQESGIRIA